MIAVPSAMTERVCIFIVILLSENVTITWFLGTFLCSDAELPHSEELAQRPWYQGKIFRVPHKARSRFKAVTDHMSQRPTLQRSKSSNQHALASLYFLRN